MLERDSHRDPVPTSAGPACGDPSPAAGQQWTAGTAAHIGGSLRSGTNAVMAGAVSVGKDLCS